MCVKMTLERLGVARIDRVRLEVGDAVRARYGCSVFAVDIGEVDLVACLLYTSDAADE